MQNTEKKDLKKVRNLKKEEVRKVIMAFLDSIKNIEINNKKLVVAVGPNSIASNPEMTIEEIRQTLKVQDKTKLDFFRQLYIRSGNQVLKKLFPDEEILNLPTVSFEEHGHNITMAY